MQTTDGRASSQGREPIDTPEQSGTPTGSADSFSALAALVAKAHADIGAFSATCSLTDSVVAGAEGRDITEADWAQWEQADQARQASVAAVLDHRPGCPAEAAAKAAAVCATEFATEVNDAEWPRVYLADALHLAALARVAQ